MPPAWPSVYHHDGLDLTVMVYVDDFKMAGPAKNLEKGWQLIRKDIKMDDPEPLNLCLGCHHHEYTENIKYQDDNNQTKVKSIKFVETEMKAAMAETVDQYIKSCDGSGLHANDNKSRHALH